jgi:hypothetical protein
MLITIFWWVLQPGEEIISASTGQVAEPARRAGALRPNQQLRHAANSATHPQT